MKLLLVDDHALFLDGLALLLRDLHSDLTILTASNVEEAIIQVDQHENFDLVLLDLGLPDGSGMLALEHLRKQREDIPVVILSSRDDEATVLDVIDKGAMGFIPKSATSAILFGALRTVLERGIYMPPGIIASGGAAPALTCPESVEKKTAMTPACLGLTPRQSDVLYQILQGKPIKLIARALDLGENTVKSHVSAVLRALKVTTRTQAVIAASRLDLRFPQTIPPQTGDSPEANA